MICPGQQNNLLLVSWNEVIKLSLRRGFCIEYDFCFFVAGEMFANQWICSVNLFRFTWTNVCGVIFFFMTGVEHISSTRFMSVNSKRSCFLQSFGRQKDRKPYLGEEMCFVLCAKNSPWNLENSTDSGELMLYPWYIFYMFCTKYMDTYIYAWFRLLKVSEQHTRRTTLLQLTNCRTHIKAHTPTHTRTHPRTKTSRWRGLAVLGVPRLRAAE